MKRSLYLVVCVVLLVFVVAAPAAAGNRTFVVHPSGDDDTAAIQQAFAAATAAGPGSTVKLSAGHFYMNNILVQGFRGSFVGAGMGRTVVDTLRGLDPARPGVTMTYDPDNPSEYLTGWTFLVGFLRSDIRVADMSFDITAAEPAETWGEGEWAGQTNVSDVLVVMRHSRSVIDRVGIKAHDGDVNGFNIEGSLAILETGGSHRITRCVFSGNNGPEIGNLDGVRLTIGGPGMGNQIHAFGVCLFLADIAGSRAMVSHNRLKADMGAGVWAVQSSAVAALEPSRFRILDNRIRAGHVHSTDDPGYWGACAVWLEDDPWTEASPVRMRTLVARNRIVLDTMGRAGGIDGLGVDRARVYFNRITGEGITGIDVGTDIYSSFGYEAFPARGWRIIGNDVSDIDLINDYGGLAAPIWLGTGSSKCLVVGRHAVTKVLDQGTDNHLVNVIELPLPTLIPARGTAPSRGPVSIAPSKF